MRQNRHSLVAFPKFNEPELPSETKALLE